MRYVACDLASAWGERPHEKEDGGARQAQAERAQAQEWPVAAGDCAQKAGGDASCPVEPIALSQTAAIDSEEEGLTSRPRPSMCTKILLCVLTAVVTTATLLLYKILCAIQRLLRLSEYQALVS